MKIEITHVESMEPLLDFSVNGTYIDIHNDYALETFFFKKESDEFNVKFIKYGKDKKCCLKFFSPALLEFHYEYYEVFKKLHLDNFAKGTLLEGNEYYNKNMNYFFLGFTNGLFIDIVCKEAYVELE